jgi:hypothetical protein
MTFAHNIDLKRPASRLITPTRYYLVAAVAGISFLLQLADAGMEAKDLFTAHHADALDFVGIGEFVMGLIATLVLRR